MRRSVPARRKHIWRSTVLAPASYSTRPKRRELVDPPVLQEYQILQLRQGLVHRRGGLQGLQAPEYLGVHAVALDQQAQCFGEVPRTVRTHRHGLHAGVRQALMRLAVVAPGGLEDGAPDTVLAPSIAHRAN